MDREGFWSLHCLVNIQQGNLRWLHGQPAGSGLSLRGFNQASPGQSRKYPPDETGTSIHTAGQISRGDVLATKIAESGHHMDRNGKLDIG